MKRSKRIRVRVRRFLRDLPAKTRNLQAALPDRESIQRTLRGARLLRHPRFRRRFASELFQSAPSVLFSKKGALVSGLCALAFVFAHRAARPPEVNAAPLRPIVRTQTLKAAPLLETIDAAGTVVQLEKASVTSRIQGRLASLLAEQGDSVKKGQKLAQIETFDLEIKRRAALAALSQANSRLVLARARHDAAKRGVERQMKGLDRAASNIIDSRAAYLNSRQSLLNLKEIYEMGGASSMELKNSYAQYLSLMSRYYQSRVDYQTGLVGFRNEDLLASGIRPPDEAQDRQRTLVDFNTQVEKSEVEVARSAVESAALDLETVNLLLREAAIVSPIEGVVAARSIEIGEEVKQGEPLFVVVRMDRLLVSMNIPEEKLPRAAAGLEGFFTIDALGTNTIQAKVHRISPVLDTKTRSAEAQLIFENKGLKASPGMFARASIVLAKREKAIALPESAVTGCRQENSQNVCDAFIVQKNLVFKRTFIAGIRSQGLVEVVSGLREGETAAITSIPLLRDGLEVQLEAQ